MTDPRLTQEQIAEIEKRHAEDEVDYGFAPAAAQRHKDRAALLSHLRSMTLTDDADFIRGQIEYAYDAGRGGLPRAEVVSEVLECITGAKP